MTHINRPLRLGMAGGGEGAFIGAVHRMAAALDGDWRLSCGSFSSDAQRNARSGAQLGLAPARIYRDVAAMLAADDASLRARLDAFRAAQTAKVLAQPDPRAALAAGGGA